MNGHVCACVCACARVCPGLLRGLNYIPSAARDHGLVRADRYNTVRQRYHADGVFVSYFDKVGRGCEENYKM